MNFLKKKPSPPIKQASIKKKIINLLIALTVTLPGVTYLYSRENYVEAQTTQFQDIDYEKMLSENETLVQKVPLSPDSIVTSQKEGDKRIVALTLFLERYHAPIATVEIAKAFVEQADINGFGDRWQLVVAISGVESGFCRLTPHKGAVDSLNCWGWGAPKFIYFNSYEDAIKTISRKLVESYKTTALDPVRMVSSYCPPCASTPGGPGNSSWVRGVNKYMNEMKAIYNSI